MNTEDDQPLTFRQIFERRGGVWPSHLDDDDHDQDSVAKAGGYEALRPTGAVVLFKGAAIQSSDDMHDIVALVERDAQVLIGQGAHPAVARQRVLASLSPDRKRAYNAAIRARDAQAMQAQKQSTPAARSVEPTGPAIAEVNKRAAMLEAKSGVSHARAIVEVLKADTGGGGNLRLRWYAEHRSARA